MMVSPQKKQNSLPNYHTEDVVYENVTTGLSIAGTFTRPYGVSHPQATVVLISQHGPYDRDYTIRYQKHFLTLADHLTKSGIAVLRFDKRGIAGSTGNYRQATNRDFADDVIAGVSYLQTRSDIDHTTIGLLGHGEGALIAGMVAGELEGIAFIIAIGGVVTNDIYELAIGVSKQLKADGGSQGFIDQEYSLRVAFLQCVKEASDGMILKNQLKKLLHNHCQAWRCFDDDFYKLENIAPIIVSANNEAMIYALTAPWYRYFLNQNVEKILEEITVPVLALYGEKDWVTCADKSLKTLKDIFKKTENNAYTGMKISGLNHLFQECEMGSSIEYIRATESINSKALNIVSDWILKYKRKSLNERKSEKSKKE